MFSACVYGRGAKPGAQCMVCGIHTLVSALDSIKDLVEFSVRDMLETQYWKLKLVRVSMD